MISKRLTDLVPIIIFIASEGVTNYRWYYMIYINKYLVLAVLVIAVALVVSGCCCCSTGSSGTVGV